MNFTNSIILFVTIGYVFLVQPTPAESGQFNNIPQVSIKNHNDGPISKGGFLNFGWNKSKKEKINCFVKCKNSCDRDKCVKECNK